MEKECKNLAAKCQKKLGGGVERPAPAEPLVKIVSFRQVNKLLVGVLERARLNKK